MQLDVSLAVLKRLTNLLRDEDDSYDAVISRLLDSVATDSDCAQQEIGQQADSSGSTPGAFFREVFLPNGTELRATYKGKTYFAKISGSEWVDIETGHKRSSPSQAAYFITGNNVNGWLFWLVKRPGDATWNSLNALRVG